MTGGGTPTPTPGTGATFTPQKRPLNTKNYVVRVPVALHEACRARAEMEGITLAELYRRALWAYVNE